jgi:hypothetical protein
MECSHEPCIAVRIALAAAARCSLLQKQVHCLAGL